MAVAPQQPFVPRLQKFRGKFPPSWVTLSSLHFNPHQFFFQLPLRQEMRCEGLPTEGFCIAAGIPTTKKAAEIISGLRSVGIRHITFNPSSIDHIRQVINIVTVNPDSAITVQWTRGSAGSHHSFEDSHQPYHFLCALHPSRAQLRCQR
jgi:fatty acid synthase subunit beta